ncbi:hypothetical protein EVAR_88728_1 [Eumeta japonica]|uniref:Uncharacterized protein n=1 Tax=Eumeta variegata TaxID=151549 RepID=A0A4C1XH68_EUMVA|nr:hypothetical protein EVAR_88728_1 [Eumeta japonica]
MNKGHMFRPKAYSPSITPQPPPVSPSPLHQLTSSPSDILFQIYIPTQEVGNALVTPLNTRVSVVNGDHLYSVSQRGRFKTKEQKREMMIERLRERR